MGVNVKDTAKKIYKKVMNIHSDRYIILSVKYL